MRQHWKEFLQNVNNIWTATRYMVGKCGTAVIPTLQSGDEVVENDKAKAELLLSTFFPPTPTIPEQTLTKPGRNEPLPFYAITRAEVKGAIMKTNPWKAPGQDDLLQLSGRTQETSSSKSSRRRSNLETFGCLLCPSESKLGSNCRTGRLLASNCLQIREVNTVRSFLGYPAFVKISAKVVLGSRTMSRSSSTSLHLPKKSDTGAVQRAT
jgi:hypothetical protein